MKSFWKYILSVATIVGSTIGVGIFSLPYITTKSGLWVMLLHLVILTAIILLINLFFGEVALKTPDFLRLPSFCQFHLGKTSKAIAISAMFLASLGALLAYIVIGGEFLNNLLNPIFGGSNFAYSLLYFLVGSIVIFFGVKTISKIDFLGMLFFVISLLLIMWQGLGFMRIDNIPSRITDFGNLFLPYGPLLFALWSATMIPEVEEMLGRSKKSIRKVITFGTLIPAVCYLLFIIIVVSISGNSTSQEAIAGLKNILGQGAASIMFLVGIITTFTCFVTLGLNLQKILWYDVKIPKNIAWFLTCFVPFALYIIGINNFIGIIGFVGGVALAIEGILILLMYLKITSAKTKYLAYPLIFILIAGIIYQICF